MSLSDEYSAETSEPVRTGERHERDAVSLMAGLLLVVVAGLFLLGDLSSVEVDGRWVGPLVLIGVGVAGLAATLRRS